MATNTAATTKSTPRRRPRTGSARYPARVLFNVTAVVGTVQGNRTSATSNTRNKVPIQVSLVFKRPPQQSTLYVCCSDLNSEVPPEVACSVDDLLLIRVNVGRRGLISTYAEDYDYFIYRAATSPSSRRPVLELLQHPCPSFHAREVGVLPRSDGHYTVAALVFIGNARNGDDLYQLHRLHSDTATSQGWSTSIVNAAAAWKPFPVDIPEIYYPIFHSHVTTTVITIGGERGTMGWVDLWRGILLCDVLDPSPALRGLPLPLPWKDMRANHGLGRGLGYPGDRRGIAFVGAKGGLKLVHMDVTKVWLPGHDEETGHCTFRVDGWTLTTWSNKEMSGSMDDWHEESSVEASEITIHYDDTAISRELLDSSGSGLLRSSSKQRGEDLDSEEERQQHGLQNLVTYQPTPCATGEDVVYLMARKKFMHTRLWMLAVEMKHGGRLRAVAYSGNQVHCLLSPMYCTSAISKYLNPKKLKNSATIQEESDEAGSSELVMME